VKQQAAQSKKQVADNKVYAMFDMHVEQPLCFALGVPSCATEQKTYFCPAAPHY
jgi:hypothetical protein